MASTPGETWKLDVFTGNGPDDLQLVASDRVRTYVPGKASVVRINVIEGQTYYLRVGIRTLGAPPAALQSSAMFPGGTLSISPSNARLPAEVYFGLGGPASIIRNARCPVIRIYQPDGQTPLTGPNYQVQLYAGPTSDELLPAGNPQPLFDDTTGFFPIGSYMPVPVVVPNVFAGQRVFAQVRAWDSSFGETFEEARANGSPVGESKIVSVIGGSEETGPSPLRGLRNFSLRAGSNL
jgi:hypothetical protein